MWPEKKERIRSELREGSSSVSDTVTLHTVRPVILCLLRVNGFPVRETVIQSLEKGSKFR
jgi:hypothetical protein